MKIPNRSCTKSRNTLSLARIVSEDSQHLDKLVGKKDKSSKDS